MKLKTKKRLRRLLTPIAIVWVCVAAIVAFAGGVMLALGFTMLGEQDEAKESIRKLI